MSRDGASIMGVEHADLAVGDLRQLQGLFDAEYLDGHGPWTPNEPYGYAGHDVHVLAHHDGALDGHVGWGRRTMSVGNEDVVIAGVGGVLVSPSERGTALGRRLMAAAAESMRRAGGIDFGYLGCREAVVPFYAACGWTRIEAAETYVDRVSGEAVTDAPGPPLMIVGIERPIESWPAGGIDLRGRPW